MRAAVVLVALMLSSIVASAARADLKAMIDPYVAIQRSLSADSLKDLQARAQRIAEQAAQLGAAGDAVQSAALDMQHAASLTAARAAFGRLGDAIIVLARDSGAGLGEDVKVAYCPMARKYWLQKGGRIENPFYGRAMSQCGRLSADLPDLAK